MPAAAAGVRRRRARRGRRHRARRRRAGIACACNGSRPPTSRRGGRCQDRPTTSTPAACWAWWRAAPRTPARPCCAPGAAVRSGAGHGAVRRAGAGDRPGAARGRRSCPGAGRVQAWVLGPGRRRRRRAARSTRCARRWPARSRACSTPARCRCWRCSCASARRVHAALLLTPHAGELARLLSDLGVASPSRDDVEARPLRPRPGGRGRHRRNGAAQGRHHGRRVARREGAGSGPRSRTGSRRPARATCSPGSPERCWPPGSSRSTRRRRRRRARPCRRARVRWRPGQRGRAARQSPVRRREPSAARRLTSDPFALVTHMWPVARSPSPHISVRVRVGRTSPSRAGCGLEEQSEDGVLGVEPCSELGPPQTRFGERSGRVVDDAHRHRGCLRPRRPRSGTGRARSSTDSSYGMPTYPSNPPRHPTSASTTTCASPGYEVAEMPKVAKTSP